ncbi:MAG: argininosuccinate synthase [Planctomycetota bacterium]
MAKAVLAFSGGLGTMAALHLLKKKKGLDVVTFTANLGQKGSTEQAGEKALQIGADSAHVGDLREKFVEHYVWPALRAGAVYESGYALSSALARPLIVAELVKIVREEGADFLAHGCAGKSNDQVRFEASAAALAPDVRVQAPLRDFRLLRLDEIRKYCQANNLGEGKDAGSRFSITDNLWGTSIEWTKAPDSFEPVPEAVYKLTKDPETAPDKADEFIVGFERGVPITVDGQKLAPVPLLELLNERAGLHGVGRLVTMEDRLIGIKMREVYEQPAATVLHTAKRALEELVLSRELVLFKPRLAEKYAELTYNGLWFSELREALDAFFEKTCEYVEGEVKVRVHKGSARAVGARSKYSLYSRGLAAPTTDEDEFSHEAVRGFMDTISLAMKHQSEHWKKEVADD